MEYGGCVFEERRVFQSNMGVALGYKEDGQE